MAVIYKITCAKNGHYYFGRTKNFNRRRISHLHLLKTGKHNNLRLLRTYQKYGRQSLIFEVVEVVNDAEIFQVEERYIAGSISDPLCMNMSHSAGRPAVPMSEETKQKISKAHKARGHRPCAEAIEKARLSRKTAPPRVLSPESQKKIADSNRGKKRTPEQCKKMGRKGDKHPQWGKFGGAHPTSKAILQICVHTGAVLARYGSISEAVRTVGGDVGDIGKVARGSPRHKTVAGFSWRYAE